MNHLTRSKSTPRASRNSLRGVAASSAANRRSSTRSTESDTQQLNHTNNSNKVSVRKSITSVKSSTLASSSSSSPNVLNTTPRPRGRPRKHPIVVNVKVEESQQEEEDATTTESQNITNNDLEHSSSPLSQLDQTVQSIKQEPTDSSVTINNSNLLYILCDCAVCQVKDNVIDAAASYRRIHRDHQDRIHVHSLKCPVSTCTRSTSNLFSTVAQLQAHLLKKHRVKRHRCLLGCRMIVGFDDESKLRTHLEQCHSARTVYQCKSCCHKAASSNDLYTHQWLVHELGHFACAFERCEYESNATDSRLSVVKHLLEEHFPDGFDDLQDDQVAVNGQQVKLNNNESVIKVEDVDGDNDKREEVLMPAPPADILVRAFGDDSVIRDEQVAQNPLPLIDGSNDEEPMEEEGQEPIVDDRQEPMDESLELGDEPKTGSLNSAEPVISNDHNLQETREISPILPPISPVHNEEYDEHSIDDDNDALQASSSPPHETIEFDDKLMLNDGDLDDLDLDEEEVEGESRRDQEDVAMFSNLPNDGTNDFGQEMVNDGQSLLDTNQNDEAAVTQSGETLHNSSNEDIGSFLKKLNLVKAKDQHHEEGRENGKDVEEEPFSLRRPLSPDEDAESNSNPEPGTSNLQPPASPEISAKRVRKFKEEYLRFFEKTKAPKRRRESKQNETIMVESDGEEEEDGLQDSQKEVEDHDRSDGQLVIDDQQQLDQEEEVPETQNNYDQNVINVSSGDDDEQSSTNQFGPTDSTLNEIAQQDQIIQSLTANNNLLPLDALTHDMLRVVTVYFRCQAEPEACQAPCGNRVTLFDHLWKKHQCDPFQCLVRGCGQTFISILELASHRDNHQLNSPTMQCCACNAIYSDYTLLFRHYHAQHIGGCFKCSAPGCGFQTLNNRATVIAHQRQMHQEFGYECPSCGKRYKSFDVLDQHMRGEHLRESTQRCVHCGKSFLWVSDPVRAHKCIASNPNLLLMSKRQSDRFLSKFSAQNHSDVPLNSTPTNAPSSSYHRQASHHQATHYQPSPHQPSPHLAQSEMKLPPMSAQAAQAHQKLRMAQMYQPPAIKLNRSIQPIGPPVPANQTLSLQIPSMPSSIPTNNHHHIQLTSNNSPQIQSNRLIQFANQPSTSANANNKTMNVNPMQNPPPQAKPTMIHVNGQMIQLNPNQVNMFSQAVNQQVNPITTKLIQVNGQSIPLTGKMIQLPNGSAINKLGASLLGGATPIVNSNGMSLLRLSQPSTSTQATPLVGSNGGSFSLLRKIKSNLGLHLEDIENSDEGIGSSDDQQQQLQLNGHAQMQLMPQLVQTSSGPGLGPSSIASTSTSGPVAIPIAVYCVNQGGQPQKKIMQLSMVGKQ